MSLESGSTLAGIAIFEQVCHLLHCAGFDIAHTRPAGLQIGLRPRGVLVGWLPDESQAPYPEGNPATGGGQVPRPDPDTWRWTVTESVVRAMAIVLRQAGCQITQDGPDLLITHAPDHHESYAGT